MFEGVTLFSHKHFADHLTVPRDANRTPHARKNKMTRLLQILQIPNSRISKVVNKYIYINDKQKFLMSKYQSFGIFYKKKNIIVLNNFSVSTRAKSVSWPILRTEFCIWRPQRPWYDVGMM